ncbi:hypothetical protein ACOSQ3_004539 [Xanthoceras sorbifolium]
MDLRHTLLLHTFMSASLAYKDVLEIEKNEAERRELRDELGEELVQKDKSLAAEKETIQDDAQSNLLYSIWLHYPDLDFRFLGLTVGGLIESFDEIRAAAANGAQDDNATSELADATIIVSGQVAPGGGGPPTGQA